ncbi:hypothetical protein TrVE_jg9395 [Triparma verrucosa]|uniref:Calcineurin-like phosphoesterase domain-containing protein n=1 Tax=Triparma verrucosa TaxID=1606542 RepID=A0A9W7CHM5_9STRA|nr:hypothetical protein TrVE_jg9395 [Triparma verrucosa]
MEDDMTSHLLARSHILSALQSLPSSTSSSSSLPPPSKPCGSLSISELEVLLSSKKSSLPPHLLLTHMVSLGDLGRKDIRNLPGDAGSSLSFEMARDFLEGFDKVPYNVITGNHDLEGMFEFQTDDDNIKSFTSHFPSSSLSPSKPYWSLKKGSTLLIGLSTTRFRSALHSSHEVYIDSTQLEWFTSLVSENLDKRVIVFSHAPPLGSGLRLLQDVHLKNGCAFLNHSGDLKTARRFIEVVDTFKNVKAWFSGHYHLSHDFEDSLSERGGCLFVQCGVMGGKSTRDGKRQTRICSFEGEVMTVWTVNHHEDGELVKDCDFNLETGEISNRRDFDEGDGDFVRTYVPEEEDGCYSKVEGTESTILDNAKDRVCWWHMSCGRVLGMHDNKLLEYDEKTLSPLGIVVEDLEGKEVIVADEGSVVILREEGCNDLSSLHVVQPNADGSYWKRFQGNKLRRMEEKKRIDIARRIVEDMGSAK